jgi:hypothetical protein
MLTTETKNTEIFDFSNTSADEILSNYQVYHPDLKRALMTVIAGIEQLATPLESIDSIKNLYLINHSTQNLPVGIVEHEELNTVFQKLLSYIKQGYVGIGVANIQLQQPQITTTNDRKILKAVDNPKTQLVLVVSNKLLNNFDGSYHHIYHELIMVASNIVTIINAKLSNSYKGLGQPDYLKSRELSGMVTYLFLESNQNLNLNYGEISDIITFLYIVSSQNHKIGYVNKILAICPEYLTEIPKLYSDYNENMRYKMELKTLNSVDFIHLLMLLKTTHKEIVIQKVTTWLDKKIYHTVYDKHLLILINRFMEFDN